MSVGRAGVVIVLLLLGTGVNGQCVMHDGWVAESCPLGDHCGAAQRIYVASERKEEPMVNDILKACEYRAGCVETLFASDGDAERVCGAIPTVCQSARGCPEFGCRAPAKGYECQECEVVGAKVTCPDNSGEDRVLVAVLAGVSVALLAAGAFVYCLRAGCIKTESGRPDEPTKDPLQMYRKLLTKGLRSYGATVARSRVTALVVVLSSVVIFAVLGLPYFTTSGGNSKARGLADWLPAGGRLAKEVDYVDKWTDVTSQEFYNFYVLIGPRDENGNALQKRYVQDMLDVLEIVHKVTVTAVDSKGKEVTIGWRQLCLSLDNPVLDAILGKGSKKMCSNPGILDCFFEGSWEFEDVHQRPLPPATPSELSQRLKLAHTIAGSMRSVNPISVYDSRPSFQLMTDAEVRAHLSNKSTKCDHWSIPASLVRDKMFGANKIGPDGNILFAHRLATFALQHSPVKNMHFKEELKDFDEVMLKDVMNKYYDKIMDTLEELDNDRERFPDTSISCFFSVSLQRMIDEVGRARYFQIALGYTLMWVFLVYSQWNFKNSAENHAWVGFIAFIFVIGSNMCAFGLISLCGFNWNHTMLQALPFLALGLGVDDVFLLLHYYRGVESKVRDSEEVIADLMERAGMSVGLTSLCNAASFFCGAIIPIPALRAFLISAGIVVITNFITTCTCLPALLAYETDRVRAVLTRCNLMSPMSRKNLLAKDLSGWQNVLYKMSTEYITENLYIPFMRPWARRLILCSLFVVTVALLSVSLGVLSPLKKGQKVTDLAPKGSYLAKGFNEMYSYFFEQHSYFSYMVKGDFGIPERQQELLALHNALIDSEWSAKSAGNNESLLFWVDLLKDQCVIRDTAIKPNVNDSSTWYCDPNKFYRTYHDWRNPHPQIGGLLALEAIFTEQFGYEYGPENYTSGNTIKLALVPWGVNPAKFSDSEGQLDVTKFVNHIDYVRDTMINITGNDVDVFPFGYEYLVMEEFLHLEKNFWIAFIACCIAITVAGLLIPVSWRGAPIIAVSAASTTIMVMAVVALSDITFNSTLAVTFLMSIGISVEFSAHVVVAFEGYPGSRVERLEHAAKSTFVPVVEGGVSSFLGFSLLVGSDFPYVVKYFFWVYLYVVLIGCWNALVFLPALLSVVGSNDGVAHEEVQVMTSKLDCYLATPDCNEQEMKSAEEVKLAEEVKSAEVVKSAEEVKSDEELKPTPEEELKPTKEEEAATA
eukprot:Hpha_TRINITY_DN12018_c0_g1::TRINITY_DN12018_c0_g1_i1::g.140867::m.140867